MTPKQKQLLLKDLCGRMPFEPICEYTDVEDGCKVTAKLGYSLRDFITGKVIIKPYLRPMSSMMEKELKDLLAYSGIGEHEIEICKYDGGAELEFWLNEVPCAYVAKVIDWLNKNMFDYRGLIPLGLALPAIEGMYNTK